jgi:hypothetical protein
MRLALSLVGTALALVAAGVIWFEFHRVVGRRRTASERPAKEPTILPTPEEPDEGKPLLA